MVILLKSCLICCACPHEIEHLDAAHTLSINRIISGFFCIKLWCVHQLTCQCSFTSGIAYAQSYIKIDQKLDFYFKKSNLYYKVVSSTTVGEPLVGADTYAENQVHLKGQKNKRAIFFLCLVCEEQSREANGDRLNVSSEADK